MIDTPQLPTDAVKWRDDITQRGEVRYIINTHHHVDHTTGNYFFPGTVVSHEGVKEMFYTSGRALTFGQPVQSPQPLIEHVRQITKERDPEGLPLMENYQPKAPTITFSERLNLYVGEHQFELIYLPGHTPGHIGVNIPEEKTFLSGDNFTSRCQPSMAQCFPLEWVESLKKIEAMDIDVVVPGHGKVCGKQEVREFRSFIQKCIDMVREAIKQGMSKEEATDKISFEALYPAVHPGPDQQRMNVSRLYEMLST